MLRFPTKLKKILMVRNFIKFEKKKKRKKKTKANIYFRKCKRIINISQCYLNHHLIVDFEISN